MRVESFCYNSKEELAANTYILISKKECVVIDPSCDYDGIINYITKNKLELKAILITHAHFDHIRGVNRLANRFGVPIYCHELDINALHDPELNCSNDMNIRVAFNVNSLCDGEELKFFKDETIRVIHTPYHTVGSVCYYLKNSNILFSGDSLFKMTIGRDDLITSVPELRSDSLKKIAALPDETKVYPGHGSITTIGHELLFNRFLKREIWYNIKGIYTKGNILWLT